MRALYQEGNPKQVIDVPAGSETGNRNPIRRLLNPSKTYWGSRGKRMNVNYIIEANQQNLLNNEMCWQGGIYPLSFFVFLLSHGKITDQWKRIILAISRINTFAKYLSFSNIEKR